MLREGAFDGLRDNIRALGEYAVQNGSAKEAPTLVKGFFVALETYDRRCTPKSSRLKRLSARSSLVGGMESAASAR